MNKRKCKVRMTAIVIAYIDFDYKNEPLDFNELDDIKDVEDFEVLDIIC